jgi:hypothetical protein
MDRPQFQHVPPAVLLPARNRQQDQLDWLYEHGPTYNSVDAYNIAAAGWLADQTTKRNLSPEPEKYVAEPFVRPKPQREVFEITEDGTRMFTWKMEPDPNIHAPVLPPYVKPQTAPGLGIKPDTSPDPEKAALNFILMQVLEKLDTLLAR